MNFLKSILVQITMIDAIIALRKVIKLALSEAIKINQIITGKTWNNIANGWSTVTFSLAYAILLRGYVTYKARVATTSNHILK